MKVLVTDGDTRAALAVTRSLGRAGHVVFVGDKHAQSLAQASRYCAERIVYPDPVSASEAFIAHLVRVVHERSIDAIVPVADIATMLVTGHRERFAGSCRIPFAAADVVRRAANKVDIVQTAERIGVPVPRSVVVRSAADVPALPFDFPVVVKPWQSRVRTADGWCSTAVSYAADAEALMRDLTSRPAHEFPVLLQERLVGPGVGVFACYRDGRPIALFSHRRLRERPPWGGVSVLAESAPLDPAARDFAVRLLDEIGWEGPAMVEFKQDERDGLPKLMEINGRFWGSLQLAIDAGVDFPALLLQETVPAVPAPYHVGVRTRWFWGDVDSLLVSLRGWKAAAGRPPSRLRTLLDFAKMWGRDLHYDNPKWDDRWPWVVETRAWFRHIAESALPKFARFVAGGATDTISAKTLATGATAAVAEPPAGRLSTRIVSTIDAIGLDEAGWNALAAGGGTDSIFQTHQWARSWWKTFGSQYTPLFIAAGTDGVVTGVAPLMVEQGRSRERVVRFLGDPRADYCDMLAAAGDRATTTALFETLLESPAWDVIELNNVPSQSPTVAIARETCEAAGYPFIIEERSVCPRLSIAGHEAEAARIFNKPSLRRRQNFFERSGTLTCRHLTTFAEIEPYLDTFFEQHVTRWDLAGTPSLFSHARNRSFYRELAAQIAERGWLLFTVIEFNHQPIAFHYGFDYHGSVTWYKPTFDVAHAAHSPGLVLMRHLIGYAIDHQRRELDFTLGDEPFKSRFTNDARSIVRIQIFHDAARLILERTRRGVVKAMKKMSGN
jgi:predicted ATP-grasp superfamily ATP-dependent carboligase/CelD/BcsL family acetyltransferase involved in cellulose biosynthesis